MSVRINDLELLEAVREFALTHFHADVERFRQSMQDWGNEWKAVAPTQLLAADFLHDSINAGNHQTRPLLEVFARHKQRLHWEQSYRKQDAVVSEAMLSAYAFAEVIGNHGPFISDRIRAGIAIWGPNIEYPRHQHRAEEIYIVLAGSARFKIGDADELSHSVGDAIFVASNTPHEFRTGDQTLVVYYLWQSGDLREISSFA